MKKSRISLSMSRIRPIGMSDRNPAENVAEEYYDSRDADAFYARIWGGEDIHIGLYEPGLSIYQASRKTVEKMAALLGPPHGDSKVLDLGAGYGGAARFLAREYGCEVTCLNLSDIQNQRNRQLSKAQGLEHKIHIVHGSFESIPDENASYDIVWSQDAFLHSGRKLKVLQEVARVLKPGGELVFTDPMQSEDCPADVLQPVYDRLQLDSLGSISFYRQQLSALGFTERNLISLPHQLRTHYFQVGERLKQSYRDLVSDVSQAYLDKMIVGLDNWVSAADAGYLAWGILHYQKAL